jgi:hypothetical protein
VCHHGYGQYLPYDSEFTENMYKVYLVHKGKVHYICVYDFGRYFDDKSPLEHPGTRLLACIPVKLN